MDSTSTPSTSTAEAPVRAERLAIVVSTGGSVMDAALRDPGFRKRVVAVLSDRRCEGVARARAHGIRTLTCETRNAERFSDFVCRTLERYDAHAALAFHLRLFRGRVLEPPAHRRPLACRAAIALS